LMQSRYLGATSSRRTYLQSSTAIKKEGNESKKLYGATTHRHLRLR
jgi:hypothetical protein